jgi:hypothetical protein
MSENNSMVLSMLIDSINPEVNGSRNDRIRAITEVTALQFTSEDMVKALEAASKNDPVQEVRNAAKIALPKHEQMLAIEKQQATERVEDSKVKHQAGERIKKEEEELLLSNMTNSLSKDEIEREELKFLISQNSLLRDIHKELVSLQTSRQANLQSVRIDDISMGIGSMVVFMLKWMVASIPVAIIVGIIYLIILLPLLYSSR